MEAEALKLLDVVKTPVFALEPDAEGRPVYVAFNQTACDISRFSAADVIGKTALEVYPGDFGRTAYQHHCRVLASGQAESYVLTLPLNGIERSVRTHLTPQLDEHGRPTVLIGTSADITLEQAVGETRGYSEDLNSEIEQFVTLAAHDLRSPIRNVKRITDMLRDDFQDLGDGKVDLIDMLERVAVKSMSLISDVLSHAQAADAANSKEEFEIKDLCQDIMQILDPDGRHVIKAPEGVILGDKVAAQIVLRNLLDNAIKHNSDRSITLSVSVNSTDSDEMYHMTVEDNGVGIPDPAIVFLGGGKLTSESGFGLLGVRKLVRARGGEITAEKPGSGRGAFITMNLPGKVLEAA